MTTYTFDNHSLFRDGKRWFPIMGEMHYSRYPQAEWKDELLKMKEGGVDIVSSYVIWIHHEEIENQFDWSGQRNLRSFVEAIAEAGLKMVLRIGPWSHAEARNGGFPDWLLTKCPKYRSNDESYFAEVRKFYAEIFKQVEGLQLKDGGPIIGIQIENEFGHCGGLQGADGEYHMQHLTAMAKEIGFDVPLWTATGWGGAITGGLLPVMGGYCDAPWDLRPEEIEPSSNYVFTYERNDHAIGCDFGLGETITFDMSKFPYLTAELGGGLQVTYRRRPVAQPEDIGAMTLTKMGSGCNLLGYYMYHGGQNPEGKLTTLEENTSTGYINDLPVKNYDFRAPLGQYGRPNGTYDEIRLFSLFVHDFGESFCATKAFIPENNPLKPDNSTDLRTSWRYNPDEPDATGYVFVNNYVRHQTQADHTGVVLSCTPVGSGEPVQFPAMDIKNGDYFFLPFNMKLGNNLLKTATVSPLCFLNGNTYVFYGTQVTERTECTAATADPALYQFAEAGDDSIQIITLPRSQALKAHKVCGADGREELIITDDVFFTDGTTRVYEKTTAAGTIAADPVDSAESNSGTRRFKLAVPAWNTEDLLLQISYRGNCARLYTEDGTLLDDSIYMGADYPWVVGMKRYGKALQTLILEIDELKSDAKIYLEEPRTDNLCSVDCITMHQVQRSCC